MKIYLAGPPEDGDEYVEAKAKLERKGHEVACSPGPPRDLGFALAELTTCDAICLMELWWSDLQATQLASVASWLDLGFVDVDGDVVPTKSLRTLR